MEIKTVGVVGAGLMGSGIAQTCAQAGCKVYVREINQELLDRGLARIYGAWDMLQGKGRITAGQVAEYREHIQGTLRLLDFKTCDLVVEAAVENLDLKREIFKELDSILRPQALIASNTSSLPVIEMAAVTKRPERVAGLHFFNPAPVMKLVEIVRTIATSDATTDTLRTFAGTLGKTPIVAKDTGGFVVNFLLIPYLLAAVRMFENGVASKEDIDTGMKLGCGYPMGPFQLLDYVGLDTTLYAAEAIYKDYPDPAYAPPTLLRRMVAAGHNGMKSGKGFFDYPEKR
ncbi:MAG TPA: 3-hydroxybutyryl-CoA dehydrogenase [Ktedonobacterales bacterium]|jgi:3-hydroxybutyryl-CoA dehydrogenase